MTMVNIYFPVAGSSVQFYHGYRLFGALAEVLPFLHGADWLQIGSISGDQRGFGDRGIIKLMPNSKLNMRLPLERLSELLPLVGRRLLLNDDFRSSWIMLGRPAVAPILSADKLHSWFVTVKIHAGHKDGFVSFLPAGNITPDNFTAALYRRLAEQNIKATLSVNRSARHYIKIKTGCAVGYPVSVSDISAADSIKLQNIGLGGRRHMGCGLFSPVMERSNGRSAKTA